MTSVDLKSIARAEIPIASAFGITGIVFILLAAAFLHVLGLPLASFALLVSAAALLWMTFRYPTTALGTVLALMSIYPITFLLAKFFGPPYVASLEGCDRVVLLLLACILWKRHGVKLVAPDWFLLGCFGLALVRLAFGGSLIILLADFSFVIAYAAGRVANLTASQQMIWARCAVWIVAVLSVLGMSEVFTIGPAPRGILYSSVASAFTPEDVLDGRFFADSFTGLRESSTMVSPPFFALLCMAALVIWWVYCRNPLPAAMITAGLICTVTRSAWLGTAGSITLLAVIMGQKRRLLLYSSLALALFVASVPILGLGDYLFSTKTRQDPSAQDHQESIVRGLKFVIGHPFGAGPGNYERPPGAKNTITTTSSAPFIESSYLMLASEYGVITSLCFLGFLLAALRQLWRERMPLSYAAIGILIGFGGAMMVAPLHQEFALASWIWFPVGLSIRSSTVIQGRSCLP
jgi:predicted tellurium resistance membrane protein TerC